MRVLEVGFFAALVIAVLAFGGADAVFLSISQLLLLSLGILVVAGAGASSVGKARLPIAVPLLLLALVFLQIAELPAALLQLDGVERAVPGGAVHNRMSIAPHATQTQFLLLLSYLAAFYLTLLICQARKGKRLLVLALLSLGLFEASYGLVQYLTGWQKIFTYQKVFGLEEATGTYINRNHFAGFLEMVLPFALALVFYHAGGLWRDPRGASARRGEAFGHVRFLSGAFWLFVAVLLFTALVFSRSRMGIVSAVASILLMSGFVASSGRQRRTAVPVVACFLLAGVIMAVWIGADPVISRFEGLSSDIAVSASQGRLRIWEDTFRLIANHPWWGTGLGTFPVAYTNVQTVHLIAFMNHAHNDYLEVTSELGFLGGILFFGVILHVLGLAVRTFFSSPSQSHRSIALACAGSLVALLMHSFTDFNLYMPGNALVLSTILGLAYSLGQETPGASEAGREQP